VIRSESYLDPAACLITGKRVDKRRIEFAATRITRSSSIGLLERGFFLRDGEFACLGIA